MTSKPEFIKPKSNPPHHEKRLTTFKFLFLGVFVIFFVKKLNIIFKNIIIFNKKSIIFLLKF